MTQTTNPPETDTDNDTETPDEQPKLQLSATQLAASSLAAFRSRLTTNGMRRINMASGLLIGGFALVAIATALL